ncbi:hypothetical protein OG792_00315 [Micromonospora sp. NBC_01699]|uniref:esterase/lipase family protein n=1 Tax=Micromonospora sp. NBC_01699 TaxID=2975984 RepID=UPI002E2A6AC6|nr:hypothetical protein [Micromonospora sp. NBC_01699]
MKRNWALLLTAFGAIALTLVGIVGVSHAAPATPGRSDSRTEPVYFVHGYDKDADTNCQSYWGAAMTEMRRWGWSGPQHTVGYYTNDTSCNVTLARSGTNTHIKDLGKKLANEIYNRYSKRGKSVDVLAHSMGGLIIRAALTGTANREAGFPPYLYVEDVVTLSTPHKGAAGFTRACNSIQYGRVGGLGHQRQWPRSPGDLS